MSPVIEPAPEDKSIDLLYGRRGPTERQAAFRDDSSRYKLYGGAVGGGKSFALCVEGIRLSLAYPGNKGFMCRNESTSFNKTTLVTLKKVIAEIEEITGAKIISQHLTGRKVIWFMNGSSIEYGSLGSPEDHERIKSLEIGWFAIDEASETPFDNFQMLKSRLRWRLPDHDYPPFFGLLASNPEPGWVKDLFVTPSYTGEPVENHAFIQALPTDNPHLPSDYVTELRKSNPDSWVKRYLDGSWSAMEGQVWPEFDYNIHVIDAFEVPKEWRRLRAIDHGQVHPTACLWLCIDCDGNLFVYNEYYSPGVVSDHCKAINEFSRGEKYIDSFLSPDCWGKTREKEGKLSSVYDEYVDQGINATRANNEVAGGLNRVGEFMKINPDRIHPITGKKGSPSLFIFRNCRNLIKEIPEYIWKLSRTEEKGKEQPKKVRDDAVDALRYGIMSRPSPTKSRINEAPLGSFNHYMKQMKSNSKKPLLMGAR